MSEKVKNVKESETVMTEVVCPNDTNPMGILLGGKLVQWMDIASAVCAQNHAERICVTASIDSVEFKAPAKVGDVITIKAVITQSFKSSMEIFVQAWARKIISRQSYLINEAYFTFVALDDNGRPVAVAEVKPMNKEEKERFENAGKRRKQRLKAKA
jgi:acyl-CoA hydrolase